MSTPAFILAAVLFVAALPGCGADYTIPLVYTVQGGQTAKCDKSIALVRFADTRGRLEIGDKDKEKFYYPEPVTAAEWVTRALGDELFEAGCSVFPKESSFPYAADYVITGELMSLYVSQKGLFDYKGDLRLKIWLVSGDTTLFEKEYRASIEKFDPSAGSAMREILTGLLTDILKQAVPDILKAMAKSPDF